MMDDSVELHAPRDAFPTKRTKSEDSSKAKRSKTVTSSSQPKSVASSVTAVERPSHCYDVLNEEYLIISWYLHVRNGVAVARNPPTCPAEKRSLGENLVNDGRMWCSAQVRLRKDVWGDSISLCEISPGIGWRAHYMQPLLLRSVHEDTS